MKKFHFPLARVIDWRRAQARLEEAKLEALYAELRALEEAANALARDRDEAEKNIASRGATGADLIRLGDFHRFTLAERARLEAQRAECARRLAAQMETLAARRRDLRLLERLKEQKLAAWNAGLNREIDAQAEESYLARWNRQGR
jgi:flagellar export protein FliJ